MTEGKKIIIEVPLSFADMHAWAKLIQEVRYENRFFLSDISSRFVDGLMKYAKKFKIHTYESGERFYRARVHDFQMEEQNFPKQEMGPPPKYKATHGRLNPVGIPYMYLANDLDTAISEVRPWIGCKITVSEFLLQGSIAVVNFSKIVFTNVPTEQDYVAHETTWRELITWMFSAPFDPRDDTAYTPTQYLAERIKKEGFDGILYDSALNKGGYNLTLFDNGKTTPGKLFDVEVRAISYQHSVKEILDGGNSKS
jgi:RES domain-containing protein